MAYWSRIKQNLGLVGLILAGMSGVLLSQTQGVEPDENPAVAKKQAVAYATFEIIVGSIAKEDYVSVQKETRKLLDLKLPSRYDAQVVEAILRIAQKLEDKQQYGVAHTIVDMALKEFDGRNESAAKLLLAKALIFKAEGKQDLALEYFNKYRQLESRSMERSKETPSRGTSKQ